LKIEAAHLGHVDIEEETGRTTLGQPVEKRASGCEALRRIASRPSDAEELATDRIVVVHNDDHGHIIHAALSS
jgi:hypothetical protein